MPDETSTLVDDIIQLGVEVARLEEQVDTLRGQLERSNDRVRTEYQRGYAAGLRAQAALPVPRSASVLWTDNGDGTVTREVFA